MLRLAIALLSLAASVIGSCPDTLPGLLEVPDSIDVTINYALVPSNPPAANNGLFCARLEVEGNSWVGFGISVSGQMIGSEAIIALPDDGTVFKYDLNGKGTNLVVKMEDDMQTLMNTSIAQGGGKTVIEFTKMLIEDGEIPILESGLNYFLLARGSSSEFGYHGSNRVAFTKDFSEDI